MISLFPAFYTFYIFFKLYFAENSNTIGRVAKEWGVENVLTKNNSSKEATSKDSITVGSNSEAAKKMSVDLKVTSKRVEECQNKHRIKKRKIC